MKAVFYRDVEGLSALYAQLGDLSLRGLRTQDERGLANRGTIEGSLGLGAFFKSMGMPSPSIDASREKTVSTTHSDTADYEVTEESMYRLVVHELTKNTRLYRDQYQAWCAARASSGEIFCEFEGQFIPAGWEQDSDAWLEFANLHGTLILQWEQDRDLKVGMSLSKIVGLCRDQLNFTGHLAMKCRDGKLGVCVFGTMDRQKYVKPYYATFI